MRKIQKQQGDVNLERIEKLPEGAVKVSAKPRGYVLAEGEHSGFAHVIEPKAGVELHEKDGTLYLRNTKPVVLNHRHDTEKREEHKPVPVEPGVWEVGHVNEYDHLADMDEQKVRPVID